MGAATAVMISLVAWGACGDATAPPHRSIPFVYSTDLHHPHQDPDDHFDLATLFALPEFDVRGVILDCGARQLEQPGGVPLRQMMHLTGRKVPHAIGLGSPLRTPDDDGRDQAAQFQDGVALILDVLRASADPVTLFTTGSVRDVAAAFNRRPELCRRKIGRLYINIGDSGAAGAGQEYNVGLDPQAYVCLLRSGLPIYWCPCFDGGVWRRERGYATYWRFVQEDVLETAPEGLQNWFLFALAKPKADPIAFLSRPQDAAQRQRVWKMRRNMWCTAPFLHAAGRDVEEIAPGRWAVRRVSAGCPEEEFEPSYAFVPARICVDDNARATLHVDSTTEGKPIQVFEILDEDRYDRCMRGGLGELFRSFPAGR